MDKLVNSEFKTQDLNRNINNQVCQICLHFLLINLNINNQVCQTCLHYLLINQNFSKIDLDNNKCNKIKLNYHRWVNFNKELNFHKNQTLTEKDNLISKNNNQEFKNKKSKMILIVMNLTDKNHN